MACIENQNGLWGHWNRLLALCLISALGACGSDGGSGGGDSASLTGVFAGGGIQGVHYRTGTQSGLTSSAGKFRYGAGETVTFSIGGIQLGSAAGAAQISLFDLYAIEAPTSEADLRAELANREQVSDFDRVANIAMLLATLDNDRTLDNGIDVTGWDQQLADTTLDFAIDLYAFSTRRGADSLTALKTVFALDYKVPVSVPLVFLYQNLGLRVAAHLPVRRLTDFDLDGSIDSVTEMAYDQLGRQNSVRYDFGADGSFETVTESEYDDLHRPVASESRSSAAASTSKREFDNNGNLISDSWQDDKGVDGIPDNTSEYSYRYDSGGNMLESVYERDDGADGVIDSRRTQLRSYDAMGNSLSETHEDDDNGDGIAERRVLRSNRYDSAGHLLELVDEVDGGTTEVADGIADYRSTLRRSYDDTGRLAAERSEADTNADGAVDNISTEEYEYDGSGRQVSRISEIDFGADGTVESRFTYSYEYADGRLVKSVVDVEHSGPVSSAGFSDGVTEYSYHANGQLQRRVDTRTAEDGSLISRTTNSFSYGPGGNLLRESSNREGEDQGFIASNYVMTYEYEAREGGLLFLLNHYDYPSFATAIGVAAFGDAAISYSSASASSSPTNFATTLEPGL